MKNACGRVFALLIVFVSLYVQSFGGPAARAGSQDQPDVILRPGVPFSIAAGSPNRVERLRLNVDQSKDRWIQAFEFLPGNPRVVRSAFVYVEKTGQWLGGWGPGQKAVEFPETVAALL